MRILFDHCTPRPLRRYLTDHVVRTSFQMGWERIVSMRGRTIAVIVMVAFDTSPVTLAPLMPQVLALLPTVEPGHVYVIPTGDSLEP